MLSARRLTEIVVELASRPGHEKIRALIYELLVYGLGARSTEIHFERPLPEVRGRADALLGQTVLEFKRDLRRERRDAEEELSRYLPQRERETGERFIGIATDGADFVPYQIEHGALVALPAFRPTVDDPRGLLVWLDSAVALRPNLPPLPGTVVTELGRGSIAYRRAAIVLKQLWQEVAQSPEVKLKRQLWADLLAIVYGTAMDADALFLQHTYLTIVAKTIAVRALEVPLPEAADLLSGRPFREAGISGAVESDFFDWVLQARDGPDLVARVSRQVSRFRLHDVEHDVLKTLYESLIDPEQRHDLGEYYTPDWLAARVCAEAVTAPTRQRVLDPVCGSGSFLFHAVRRFFEAAEAERLPAVEALRQCLERVIGIDIHPVAVLVSRITYLLALGQERLRMRPEALSLPVYLGDALQWNTRQMLAVRDVVIRVPDGPELLFPEQLANDPARFDETVSMMLELSETNAGKESFRSWLRHLQIRDAHDADVLVATYEHLRRLRQAGRDHIWGYVARNLSRPLWLSAAGQRADVILGNPPWLSFRYMTGAMQSKFRAECKARRLWAGGKLATNQDLSAYFFARAAELYLRPGGTIALVLPYAALNRAQFTGLRQGRFGTVEVRFSEAWAFNETVRPLFPMPSCVLFAEQRPAGPLPAEIVNFTGALPRRDASPAQAEAHLRTRRIAWPAEAARVGGSPYRHAFRQGATMTPRRLCVVERVATGRLGVNPMAPLVQSRQGTLDKPPWRGLTPLQAPVEAKFLRPLYLGESIAAFRLLRPVLAVIPWDPVGERLLDAGEAEAAGYPGLSRWLRKAEQHWREQGRATMSLMQRWNYLKLLQRQFPPAPIRVVYTKSGVILSAAILDDRAAIVDHKLYWNAAGEDEAHYLVAVLNSETMRLGIEALQSRGRWGVRDIDKLVFELPIPRYDAADGAHGELAEAGRQASELARAIPLADGRHFSYVRRDVRAALAGAEVIRRIERLVGVLLAD